MPPVNNQIKVDNEFLTIFAALPPIAFGKDELEITGCMKY
jgi:hypothetical protein